MKIIGIGWARGVNRCEWVHVGELLRIGPSPINRSGGGANRVRTRCEYGVRAFLLSEVGLHRSQLCAFCLARSSTKGVHREVEVGVNERRTGGVQVSFG